MKSSHLITPRTLAEAFGPYTSNEVLPMPEPRTQRPRPWVWIALYSLAFLVVYLTR